MSAGLRAYELRPAQFAEISQLVHRVCGISLRPGKEELVRSRLIKRLHALGVDDFDAYFTYLQQDTSGQELITMIDVLTTNKTNFFREPQHFTFLVQHVLPPLQATGQAMRFWSAGCSSGEEPYSLAMTLRESLPDIDRRDVPEALEQLAEWIRPCVGFPSGAGRTGRDAAAVLCRGEQQ